MDYRNNFCGRCGAKREGTEAYCECCGAPFAQPAPAQPPLYGPGAPVVTAPPQSNKLPGWAIALIVILVFCQVVVPIIAGTIIGVVFVRSIPNAFRQADYDGTWEPGTSVIDLYEYTLTGDDFALSLPGINRDLLIPGSTAITFGEYMTVFTADHGTKRIVAEYVFDYDDAALYLFRNWDGYHDWEPIAVYEMKETETGIALAGEDGTIYQLQNSARFAAFEFDVTLGSFTFSLPIL